MAGGPDDLVEACRRGASSTGAALRRRRRLGTRVDAQHRWVGSPDASARKRFAARGAFGFVAFLIPEMIRWSRLATGFGSSYHGFPAWMLLVLAAGVFASGIRDLIASARPAAARPTKSDTIDGGSTGAGRDW